MVERLTMNKGVALGYGNLDDLELVGRAFGYDIYVDKVESTYNDIWVYDRNVTKRFRHVEVWNKLSKTPGVVVYAKKSPYSKVFDFPKAGNRELVGKVFDLYDSDAEIFAVAG